MIGLHCLQLGGLGLEEYVGEADGLEHCLARVGEDGYCHCYVVFQDLEM